jgi:hypothetical protein
VQLKITPIHLFQKLTFFIGVFFIVMSLDLSIGIGLTPPPTRISPPDNKVVVSSGTPLAGATLVRDAAMTPVSLADAVSDAVSVSVATGVLPAGVAISGTSLTGTPTAIYDDTVTLDVTRGGGGSVQVDVPLRVIAPVSSITTREGITFTFSAPALAGEFETGGIWIESGASIASTSAPWNGSTNGTTLNPLLTGTGATQGWTTAGDDQTAAGIGGDYLAADNVDPALAGNPALSIPVNEYAVKFVFNGDTQNPTRYGCGAYIPIFSVASNDLPPPNALRKPMYLVPADRAAWPWMTTVILRSPGCRTMPRRPVRFRGQRLRPVSRHRIPSTPCPTRRMKG